MQQELARLAALVDAAVDHDAESMGRAVLAALREATATPVWLPLERRRVNHENYARHLLHGDPRGRFSILSIVWDHGQQSPVHGHHCWCAVGVYLGTLTETRYREEVAGVPLFAGTKARPAGSLSFDAAGAGIHRIANESGGVAISLHVYGVGASEISTRVNRILAHAA
ncbi:MAG: cysteine dioxygenase family protein [Burkholderiales bacterium]|nr:cysteine dioxygenase family protein [Burkholderiales bacterium]